MSPARPGSPPQSFHDTTVAAVLPWLHLLRLFRLHIANCHPSASSVISVLIVCFNHSLPYAFVLRSQNISRICFITTCECALELYLWYQLHRLLASETAAAAGTAHILGRNRNTHGALPAASGTSNTNIPRALEQLVGADPASCQPMYTTYPFCLGRQDIRHALLYT